MTDELSAAKSGAVIRLLRNTADRIEAGELPADAALVVVSEGDVHRPDSVGYADGPEWVNARQSLHDFGGDRSPEDRAEWRAEQKRQRQDDQDTYDRAHPWKCNCHQRFKTHRGWKTHRGAMRRQSARYNSTIVYGGSEPPGHETVIEIDAPDPEPPIQLFPQSS